MIRIMIIEDDTYLKEELMMTFAKKGYQVSGISSFAAPEQEIMDFDPDLLVLDINLPGKSGFELCKWLKAHTSFPILVLTARDTLEDELTALGLGADDFLVKPCHPDRLLARAARLLQNFQKVKSLILAGGLSLDTDTYKLIFKDTHVILPETEGKIIQLLMERHPAVVTRAELFDAVWGTEEFCDENILQVNIARLRKRLGALGLEGVIQTLRGQGYYLEVDNL